jgi:putative glycosyltransferase (TIGR04372 family)
MSSLKQIAYVSWLSIHSSPCVKWVVGILVAFTLSLISPLRDIRLGYLHADSLGGLITQADLALALRDRRTDSGERSTKDFIIFPVRHSNPFVVEQYAELFRQFPATKVLDGPNNLAIRVTRLAALGLEQVAVQHPRLRRHYCGSPTWEGLDADGFEEDGRPRLVVEPAVRNSGWDSLAYLGIDREKPFICFGNRDTTYWSGQAGRDSPSDGGGSTQDFRNTTLANYLPGLERLIGAGYTVVRMGSGAFPCDALTDLGVIDYANSSVRSDALDVLLFADCQAAIFGGSFGLAQLALAFHKPVCVTDYRPFIFTEWSTPYCHLTPSLLRDRETGVTLRLEQMLQHPYNLQALYERESLEFVPNTTGDIDSSILEFMRALEDPGLRSNESELQREFWRVVAEKRPDYAWYPRPNGKAFKRHRYFDPQDHSRIPRKSRVSESFLVNNSTELFE